ncbi:hypothetical protein MAA5396_04755 [Marinovum algicola]|uniref:Lipoprotein n=1 Tax=Marinovum algicola TaxID=42444 RepID=A0A975WEP2_9RHOB|nr:hypothetical protein [Marinovum algicola]SEK08291.1 hypothetical protein SAMN04487940_12632 [Marinovum algicola]SLN76552.1 hypothetical protein MAA5396_04755 [Marinovum algicola]
MKRFSFIAVFALLAACAETTTTQLASNVVRIDASAAPACGRTGAIKLVNKMAAVETLRLGYDKYIISNSQAQNNVRVVGHTYNTTGTYGYGTFNANTYATPIIGGSTDAAVIVYMYKAGDPQGRQAIDARTTLGANWQEIVAEGPPTTCN